MKIKHGRKETKALKKAKRVKKMRLVQGRRNKKEQKGSVAQDS